MQPERKSSRLQLSLVLLFYEKVESSACSLSFIIPVEAVSPPLFIFIDRPFHLAISFFLLERVPLIIQLLAASKPKSQLCLA